MAQVSTTSSDRELRDTLLRLKRSLPPGSRFRYTLLGQPRIVHIDELAIPARLQRQGIGTRFLGALIAAADRDALRVRLVADPTDRPGDPDTHGLERWYRRFGFRIIGTDADTQSPRMSRTPR